MWTAHSDGTVEKLVLPNDPGKSPIATARSLSLFDRDTLRAIVASSEFRTAMTSGFACQGSGHDPDATLQVAFGAATQYVERCTHGADAATALPTRLLGVVR